MRTLALLIALFMIIIGVVGLVAPDRLMAVAQYVITPAGLLVIGALRVLIGIVLMLAASTSRAPRLLRVLGGIVLIAGIATPLFGVDRTRGIVDWAAAQGPALLRAAGMVIVAVGSFIAFAVGARRRSA